MVLLTLNVNCNLSFYLINEACNRKRGYNEVLSDRTILSMLIYSGEVNLVKPGIY